jgi:hypothetical protein
MMKAQTLSSIVSSGQDHVASIDGMEWMTDKQITLKMITKLKLKMFAMPSAKHNRMQITPVLEIVSTFGRNLIQ